MTRKIKRETDNIRFAYLNDPANESRVVTFAWRRDEDRIEYAFAVNRVVSPPGKPDITKSTKEQRFYDPHNRVQARLITSRRLNSKRKRWLVLKHPNDNVLDAISEDFIFNDFNEHFVSRPQKSLPPSVRIKVISDVLWRTKSKKNRKARIEEAFQQLQQIVDGCRRNKME